MAGFEVTAEAPLAFVLQANGVVIIGWIPSVFVYLVVVIGFVWAYLRWQVPTGWAPSIRYGGLAILGICLTALSIDGVLTEFRRERAAPEAKSIRPYDLGRDKYKELKASLKPPIGKHDLLRFGCVNWSERSCVAAGAFIGLFSEAGWGIDQNKVFRVDTAKPTDGISLVTRTPKEMPDNLPPHLGWWHTMDQSEQVIWSALTRINVKTAGSYEKELPDGVLGIYFGPEPSDTH
jgi:hypothetical protein